MALTAPTGPVFLSIPGDVLTAMAPEGLDIGEPTRIGAGIRGDANEIAKAAAAGIDTFITGEGPHWSYTLAEELQVNLFYAGHYATETFGVKAAAELLARKLALPWQFIDHPTGL